MVRKLMLLSVCNGESQPSNFVGLHEARLPLTLATTSHAGNEEVRTVGVIFGANMLGALHLSGMSYLGFLESSDVGH